MKTERPKPDGRHYKKKPLLCPGFWIGFGFDTGIAEREEESKEGSKGSPSDFEECVLFHLAETDPLPESGKDMSTMQ